MTEAPVPPRQPGSALEDVLPTAIDVLGDPRGFFTSMPREGGYEAPGIFAAVMVVTYAVIVAVFTLLRLQLLGVLMSLIVMPIVAAIGLLIGSAVVLFLSRALGGDASFETSFRIVAYSAALLPIQAIALLIPYLPILVQAYGFYLLIMGVVAVHKVEEQKAWTVLGSVAAVLLVFSLVGTIAARRVAPHIDRIGRDLEKSAAELNRATDKFRRELDHAAEQMKQEPPPDAAR
ncbi:MAG TPA: Yip1 family protein [Candidatus Binatia bacterium]|nr:Yip1 family protein [Candidatus Binatia bacterium]